MGYVGVECNSSEWSEMAGFSKTRYLDWNPDGCSKLPNAELVQTE